MFGEICNFFLNQEITGSFVTLCGAVISHARHSIDF